MDLGLTQFSLFVVFSIGLGLLGFLLLTGGEKQDRTLERRLFLAAFAVRCAAAVLLYIALNQLNGSPFVTFGNDDYFYHERAIVLAAQWSSGEWFFPTYHSGAFDSLCALFYLAFGPVPLVVRCLQCFAGAMCAPLSYRVASQSFNPQVGRRVGILIVFLPDLILWSAVQYRDMLLAALMLYLVWFFIVRLKSGFSIHRLALPMLALGAYLTLDIFGGAILMCCLIVGYLINLKRTTEFRGVSVPRVIFAAAVIVLVAGSLLVFANTLRDEQSGLAQGPVEILMTGERRMDVVRQDAGGASLSNQFLVQDNPYTKVIVEPIRFFFPLFLPIPYGAPKLDLAVLWVGSLIWYLLIPYAFYEIFLCIKTRFRDTFLLYGIPFFTLLGIYAFFYSGSPRYRVRFMPLLWILSAAGVDSFRRFRMAYIILLSVFSMIFLSYLIIKVAL